MIRLRILGDVDLRSAEGTPIGSVLSQPRRFALLVFMALDATGGGVARDRLLGIFWPELSQEKARQALRTALHFLRRSLGRDAIIGHGDLLTLNPDAIDCDAAALRAALGRGDREEALRLYGGELLPGFHVDGGTVEFEHWLDGMRATFRRETAGAAWSLATEHERAGNAAAAGARAREAAELLDGDEAAVRCAIELLGRIGDRSGALNVYGTFARRLAAAFDATPSPETQAAIERIRAGEVGTASVGAAAVVPAPAEERSAVGPSGGSSPGLGTTRPWLPRRFAALRTGRWRSVVSGAVSVVLAVAFYSLWGVNRVDPAWTMPRDASPVVQIEELRDFSAGGIGEDLAGALTLELAAQLSDIDGMVVVLHDAAPAADGAVERTPKYVLSGGIIRSDSVTRVTLMLLDGSSGATLERVRVEAPTDDRGVATVDELAETLGRRVRHQVGRALDDHERSSASENPRALTLVRTALRDLEAGDSLRRANAPAAARLSFEAADSQLALAAVAAPGWSEPSVQRAEVAFRTMWLHLLPPKHNIEVAVHALRPGLDHVEQALRIGPDDPAALELRGTLRYFMWQFSDLPTLSEADPMLDQAILDLRRATDLDPGRGRAWSVLSGALEMQGDFAAANFAARRAYRADAYLENVGDILARMFSTSLEIGDEAAAERWCDEVVARLGNSWLGGYCRLEQLAWQAQSGDDVADRIEDVMESVAPDNPVSVYAEPRLRLLAAAAHAKVGSVEEAEAEIARTGGAGGTAPDLLELEAWARLLLGQEDRAAALLARAIEVNPKGARALMLSRRFDELRANPQLSGLPGSEGQRGS